MKWGKEEVVKCEGAKYSAVERDEEPCLRSGDDDNYEEYHSCSCRMRMRELQADSCEHGRQRGAEPLRIVAKFESQRHLSLTLRILALRDDVSFAMKEEENARTNSCHR